VGIVLFKNLKMETFVCEDSDRGESFPKKSLGITMVFYLHLREISSPKILLK
jgi:hypothetical protein